MSFIVETGAGLSYADSFASVANFRDFHTARGRDVSALTDTKIEQALRLATDYIEQKYRFRFAGSKVLATQYLSWPRMYVEIKDAVGLYGSVDFYGYIVNYLPSDSVPPILINVCCDLAYKSTTAELMADTKQQVLSRTVGPLTTVFDKYSSQQTQYASIDAWLQPLLKIGGGGVQMVRC
jgi:hypothetical protein